MKGDRSGRIAGVLLAAGTSSRMGRNKLFLPLGGISVLRRAVASAPVAASSASRSSSGRAPASRRSRRACAAASVARAAAELEGLTCIPVINEEYARGMNTSVRAGISAVPDDASGAVVMLADMPFVTAGMLRTLVERYRSSETPVVVSTYGDVLAPPILYGRALFPELRALDGDGCGKRVVKAHHAEAVEVAWDPAALADLDVPDDVERVRTRIEGGA